MKRRNRVSETRPRSLSPMAMPARTGMSAAVPHSASVDPNREVAAAECERPLYRCCTPLVTFLLGTNCTVGTQGVQVEYTAAWRKRKQIHDRSKG